jgi:hypothetical protein
MNKFIKRIEKIEMGLNFKKSGKPNLIILSIDSRNEQEKDLPQDKEQWLTYQEQIRQNPHRVMVMLIGKNELEKRRNEKH